MGKIKGTDNRPRLLVFRSNKNIYAQIVNDIRNTVLTGCSSLSAEIKNKKKSTPKEISKEVGKLIAKKAMKKNVVTVVFDRRKYKFHGNVKELAEGAREEGLEF